MRAIGMNPSNCDACGTALLSHFYFEEGKTFHAWCAPSTLRKQRMQNATDAVIMHAREVVKAHLEQIYPPVDVLQAKLEELDEARAALKPDD